MENNNTAMHSFGTQNKKLGHRTQIWDTAAEQKYGKVLAMFSVNMIYLIRYAEKLLSGSYLIRQMQIY